MKCPECGYGMSVWMRRASTGKITGYRCSKCGHVKTIYDNEKVKP